MTEKTSGVAPYFNAHDNANALSWNKRVKIVKIYGDTFESSYGTVIKANPDLITDGYIPCYKEITFKSGYQISFIEYPGQRNSFQIHLLKPFSWTSKLHKTKIPKKGCQEDLLDKLNNNLNFFTSKKEDHFDSFRNKNATLKQQVQSLQNELNCANQRFQQLQKELELVEFQLICWRDFALDNI